MNKLILLSKKKIQILDKNYTNLYLTPRSWNRLRLSQKDPQLLETGVGDPSYS